MSKRIIVSFRENDTDTKILKHLEKYSEVVGTSAYIKQLLYEDMLEKNSSKEVEPTK